MDDVLMKDPPALSTCHDDNLIALSLVKKNLKFSTIQVGFFIIKELPVIAVDDVGYVSCVRWASAGHRRQRLYVIALIPPIGCLLSDQIPRRLRSYSFVTPSFARVRSVPTQTLP